MDQSKDANAEEALWPEIAAPNGGCIMSGMPRKSLMISDQIYPKCFEVVQLLPEGVVRQSNASYLGPN